MSYDKAKYSLEPTARKLVAVGFAVCINVLLFLMVDALFSVDLGASSGGLLS
jgi:hypothetical protein